MGYEMPAPYDVEELRGDAERLREAHSAVDEAQAELTDLLNEVRQRLEATSSCRHPVFDLDYPNVDDAEFEAMNAAEDPTDESIEALMSEMSAAADDLDKRNADAWLAAEADAEFESLRSWMLPYSHRIQWDGWHWINAEDKRYPNCMDPDRCSRCRTKYVVQGRDNLCSACDPGNPVWEWYRTEAMRAGCRAPSRPLDEEADG